MKRLLPVILLLGCWISPLRGAESPEVRVQSVECSYDVPEGQACCTLRLHVQLQEGSSFVPPSPGNEAASPLIGVDAEGNVLLGKFRAVESCMERCRTLVYDFYMRPRGGWMEFNTSVTVFFSGAAFRMNTEAFDPRQAGALRTLNHTFFVEPLSPAQKIPGTVLLRLEYALSPLVAAISFCDEDGSVCESRLIEGSYDSEEGMTSATYLLRPVAERKSVLRLSFFHPPVPHRLPVRFRIYPGLVAEPPSAG